MDDFSYEVSGENLIHLKLGNLDSPDKIEALRILRTNVVRAIEELYSKSGGKVHSLVDISSIEKYTPEAFSVIVGLLKDTLPYVKSTATYGANSYIMMAQEAVAAISGRENLKGFITENEAREWLLKDKDKK